jgi:thymidylate synthase (FAD)
MKVKLVDKMGSDLSVVNAARVSFAKVSEWERPDLYENQLKDSDIKLIQYLAKHNHWSPFAHTSLQFHIKAPIFVARQLVKHQVGLIWNEVSRRYVDDEPEFYIPQVWRKRPDKSIKQGSSDETTDYDISPIIMYVSESYNNMLKKNIAPEMARMILPQNLYTEWYWSGTLYAFSRVCNLRCAKDTQSETRTIADGIRDICSIEFPISWGELYNVE